MPALQSVWFDSSCYCIYVFLFGVGGAHSLLPSPDCSATRRSICRQPIIWSMQESLSCQSVCCSVLFGRKRHGEIIGVGTRRKHGQSSLGWGYLIYIHLRLFGRVGSKSLYVLLIFSFFGVANVLVWSELSSGGTAKYTFI